MTSGTGKPSYWLKDSKRQSYIINKMSRLSNKVALVTGASRGIGRATALALAKEGANVVVNYISSAAAAEEVVKKIGSDRAVAIQADVSKREDIARLIKETIDRFGKIDILVLNAGLLWQKGDLLNIKEEDFDSIFAANVKGPLFTVQEAAPYIPDGGRVMLFSTSLAAFSMVTPNYLLYTATKGAVEQMTRLLAKDLGRRLITVNTIAPGPIGTDTYYVGKTEQMVQLQSNLAPAGRLGTPEEVANVVVFVASDESSWINGQTVRINGGMTVG
jgi:3-oxoacyl-[acyl-carrier protein] reductase